MIKSTSIHKIFGEDVSWGDALERNHPIGGGSSGHTPVTPLRVHPVMKFWGGLAYVLK